MSAETEFAIADHGEVRAAAGRDAPTDRGAAEAGGLRDVAEQVRQAFPRPLRGPELVLIDVDPRHLHAFWTVAPRSAAAARDVLGAGGDAAPMVLRVSESTGGDGGGVGTAFDVEVVGLQGHCYVDVWGDARRYEGAIGLLQADGEFVELVRSAPVTLPRLGPADTAPAAAVPAPPATEATSALTAHDTAARPVQHPAPPAFPMPPTEAAPPGPGDEPAGVVPSPTIAAPEGPTAQGPAATPGSTVAEVSAVVPGPTPATGAGEPSSPATRSRTWRAAGALFDPLEEFALAGERPASPATGEDSSGAAVSPGEPPAFPGLAPGAPAAIHPGSPPHSASSAAVGPEGSASPPGGELGLPPPGTAPAPPPAEALPEPVRYDFPLPPTEGGDYDPGQLVGGFLPPDAPIPHEHEQSVEPPVGPPGEETHAAPSAGHDGAPAAEDAESAPPSGELPLENVMTLSSWALGRERVEFEINAELHIFGRARVGTDLRLFGRKVTLRPDGTFSVTRPLPSGALVLSSLLTGEESED